MIVTVQESDRYLPVIPCPWRHDPALKPPQIVGKRVDVAEQVRWIKEHWQVNPRETTTRHILYDVDSWYLCGVGVCYFDLAAIRAETEKIVQKLLKNGGSPSLTAQEKDVLLEDYMLPDSRHLSLEELVHEVEELKCKPTGQLFYEAFRADPFHTRHLHRFPDRASLVTRPVATDSLPNAYATFYVSQRDYTDFEHHLLETFLNL
jgi:hypothetical protein